MGEGGGGGEAKLLSELCFNWNFFRLSLFDRLIKGTFTTWHFYKLEQTVVLEFSSFSVLNGLKK